MARIVIIGTTGVGKTTLAQNIATKYGYTFIDLDLIHWLPDWVERRDEDFLSILDEKTKTGDWVISGNYSKSRHLTWERAHYLIWLDYGFLRNFWQILCRSINRAWTGKEILNGNRETFKKMLFSKDSILLWFFKSFHKNRKRHKIIFNDTGAYPHLHYIHLKSPNDTKKWLQHFQPKDTK